ncbi:hypothetical protein A1OE_585 [Candidatus Endolissoclinum faulkneri L2]|uniref:Uncharacterized protein n=1 Tax=Candidatus Endolissoclinum faulkneri L2 TaxID=1193729 RepID=K7ZCP4_9PROT|nr:hypothetical protein A1OE_585 [Candidatus Endolissoclinum faulkneri L2]
MVLLIILTDGSTWSLNKAFLSYGFKLYFSSLTVFYIKTVFA